MLPQRALLMLLLLQMMVPILAGVYPTNSHTDFGYCRTRETEPCALCAEDYQLWQPCEVQARASGSVVLPCTFRQSWGPTRDVRVSWHAGYFRSNIVVFNTTETGSVPVHSNFSGRARLEGDPLSGDASLLIRDLRHADSDFYYCRVAVLTESHGWKSWQAIFGTRLTVITMGTNPQPLCGGFLLSAVRAAWILLALVVLGLGVLLARRRALQRI